MSELLNLKVKYSGFCKNETGDYDITFTASKDYIFAIRAGVIAIKNAINLGKKDMALSVTKWHEKRSLDANAYAWVLITKIAEAITSTKDDVYLTMLKRYGQGGIVKIKKEQVELFKQAYKYNEEHEKLFDDKCVYMRFWVGSSNYNSEEMSKFIDGIVSECQQMDIETMTPAQLEAIKSAWKK